MHNILLEIIDKKRKDIINQKKLISVEELQKKFDEPIGIGTFKTKVLNSSSELSIVAEIKLASPTEGYLGSVDDIVKRGLAYQKAGVDALSVVVEKHYFKGDVSFVSRLKEKINIPILEKDFVIDSYQIYEARSLGADAILLIARLVDEKTLKKFVALALKIGIEPVVEINSIEDLGKALATSANIIGVNARDLSTFNIDVEGACRLIQKIPNQYIKLGFSGIKSGVEMEKYKQAGAKGVLVGTSIMKAENIQDFMNSLREESMNVKVKICATRSLEAAQVALDAGADFLGFIFTPHIKTHTTNLDVAKEIAKKMKDKINLVGVFQNMPLHEVKKIIKDCSLDYAQFHGDEAPEYIDQIKVKVIKAFRFPGDFDVEKARSEMNRFKVDYYLVDRVKQSEGSMLNLEKVAILAKEFPLVFAGGLNSDNVAGVIKKVKPQMVDVSSGVETDEKQDLEKIKTFIKNAKGALT